MPARNKLFVYEKALLAAESCEHVARHLAGVRPHLADQLRRASDSIVLNIAEGAAEFAPREKLRFYRIARRSAAESDAALELTIRVVQTAPDVTEARSRIHEVMALLALTSKAVEREL
jgi:four helix bundle protein